MGISRGYVLSILSWSLMHSTEQFRNQVQLNELNTIFRFLSFCVCSLVLKYVSYWYVLLRSSLMRNCNDEEIQQEKCKIKILICDMILRKSEKKSSLPHTLHVDDFCCRCFPKAGDFDACHRLLACDQGSAHIWWDFFSRLVMLFIWPSVSIPFNTHLLIASTCILIFTNIKMAWLNEGRDDT